MYVNVCVQVLVCVCKHVGMRVYVCVYVCMYVCMYECMYVYNICVRVCMYVCICNINLELYYMTVYLCVTILKFNYFTQLISFHTRLDMVYIQFFHRAVLLFTVNPLVPRVQRIKIRKHGFN